jgi:hypothetical protein
VDWATFWAIFSQTHPATLLTSIDRRKVEAEIEDASNRKSRRCCKQCSQIAASKKKVFFN